MDNPRCIDEEMPIIQRNTDLIQRCARELGSRDDIFLVACSRTDDLVHDSGFTHVRNTHDINIFAVPVFFDGFQQIIDGSCFLAAHKHDINRAQAY